MKTGSKNVRKMNQGTADRMRVSANLLMNLAEREGFEPSVQVLARTTV